MHEHQLLGGPFIFVAHVPVPVAFASAARVGEITWRGLSLVGEYCLAACVLRRAKDLCTRLVGGVTCSDDRILGRDQLLLRVHRDRGVGTLVRLGHGLHWARLALEGHLGREESHCLKIHPLGLVAWLHGEIILLHGA